MGEGQERAIITWDGSYLPSVEMGEGWEQAEGFDVVGRVMRDGQCWREVCANDVAAKFTAYHEPSFRDFWNALGNERGKEAWDEYVRPPGPGWKCPNCGHGRSYGR